MNLTLVLAQCVMCYRNAAAQGAARARVFDFGIAVLLLPPAIILAAVLWRAIRSDLNRNRGIQPEKQGESADIYPG